jgi:hypothetical protein
MKMKFHRVKYQVNMKVKKSNKSIDLFLKIKLFFLFLEY